ncbi:MAG: STAS-like domain-containing protein, partial [Eggerthellaceae bacterium]|nr:STAS-like domain-containing protein [Eggerthellaceae bacterium]
LEERLTKAQVEAGVIQRIEWCLNEAMDNVLQHSDSGSGFFMSQLAGNGRFSACIFDNGIGIYNSLRGTHKVATPFDAITLALQERVTRDNAIGQGNGLWGLSELVLAGNGQYRITSGGATYFTEGDGSASQAEDGFWYPSEGLGTTLVDFQLDTSAPIDISETLNGHTPIALWLEEFESPTGEDYVIKIASESEGTGTRKAAEKVRHMALNILKEGKRRVVLDFDGVNLISSSYADELVGKLVAEVGFFAFGNLFALVNLSDFNQKILDRSVQQRMAQTYYNEPAPSDEDDSENGH